MLNLTPFNKKNSLRRTDGIEDFYNVLEKFFTSPLSTSRNLMDQSFKLDVKDEQDKYVVEAELPGIQKEEINLQLDEGRLTISVKREEEEEEEKEEKDYVHRERRYTSMSRSIYLGDTDNKDISAKLEDGVLCIEIPKDKEKEKTKKIPIE